MYFSHFALRSLVELGNAYEQNWVCHVAESDYELFDEKSDQHDLLRVVHNVIRRSHGINSPRDEELLGVREQFNCAEEVKNLFTVTDRDLIFGTLEKDGYVAGINFMAKTANVVFPGIPRLVFVCSYQSDEPTRWTSNLSTFRDSKIAEKIVKCDLHKVAELPGLDHDDKIRILDVALVA